MPSKRRWNRLSTFVLYNATGKVDLSAFMRKAHRLKATLTCFNRSRATQLVSPEGSYKRFTQYELTIFAIITAVTQSILPFPQFVCSLDGKLDRRFTRNHRLQRLHPCGRCVFLTALLKVLARDLGSERRQLWQVVGLTRHGFCAIFA